MTLESLGLTKINTRGVDADGFHRSMLGEPPRGVGGEPGKMQVRNGLRSGLVGAKIASPVIPPASEARVDQDDHVHQLAFVPLLPSSKDPPRPPGSPRHSAQGSVTSITTASPMHWSTDNWSTDLPSFQK